MLLQAQPTQFQQITGVPRAQSEGLKQRLLGLQPVTKIRLDGAGPVRVQPADVEISVREFRGGVDGFPKLGKGQDGIAAGGEGETSLDVSARDGLLPQGGLRGADQAGWEEQIRPVLHAGRPV